MSLARVVAVVAAALSAVIVAPAAAGPPTDTLRASIDGLLAVLDDTALKTPARAAERRRAVRGLTEKALDFRESARRALGPHWEGRTPAERDRFVRVFTDLVDHAYLTRLSVDGERIVLDGEALAGTDAVVKGRAVSKSGAATPVEFALHQGPDGGWRVYDVSFEGMSLVGNYRAQFNKILRPGSFEDLVALLEAKMRTP